MAIVVVSALALWALLPMPASSQDESTLRGKIERGRERERTLTGAVGRLDTLLARTQRELAIVHGRLTEVEGDLVVAEARLARTQERLRSERARLERLKVRLADGRELLAEQLVAAYKADEPDIVSLVVRAHDFADLIE